MQDGQRVAQKKDKDVITKGGHYSQRLSDNKY